MSRRKLDGDGEEEAKKVNLMTMPGRRGAVRNGGASAGTKVVQTGAPKSAKSRSAKKALRDAVKAEVKKKSADIARQLVEKAAEGDMRGTAVVLSLIEKAKQENAATRKMRSGPSWAELLASEPEWEDSAETGGAKSEGRGTRD